MQITERDKIKLEIGFCRISKLTTRIPVLLFQLYCQGILWFLFDLKLKAKKTDYI